MIQGSLWLVIAGLVLVHLLYDFHWQGPFVSEWKGKNDFVLLVHATTWALMIMTVLWFFQWPQTTGRVVVNLVMLIVSHAIIDRWKARMPNPQPTHLYIDQLLHAGSVALLFL